MNEVSEETVKEFKKELKELLEKYNADICVHVSEGSGFSPLINIDVDDTTVISIYNEN